MSRESPAAATAETRKLAAIMFTDMVGFSRQMGANEAGTLRVLEVHNHIIQQAVAEYAGHVIKTIGDAFLVDFPSVVNAVQCAQRIQAQFRTHNAEKELAEAFVFHSVGTMPENPLEDFPDELLGNVGA